MPGGGVGIFNGTPLHPSPLTESGHESKQSSNTETACTNQYGAPSNGWGDRYGGIHSQSECNSFPEKLKAGCNWRFDWCVP
jgi:hypothetical protein